MSRDKQIEEMAASVCRYHDLHCIRSCANCWRRTQGCDKYRILYRLAELNYRKASDVASEIIRDIVDPVWRAYQNSENEMTSLLAAFICECIVTKIKQKYESEGADDEGDSQRK